MHVTLEGPAGLEPAMQMTVHLALVKLLKICSMGAHSNLEFQGYAGH